MNDKETSDTQKGGKEVVRKKFQAKGAAEKESHYPKGSQQICAEAREKRGKVGRDEERKLERQE